MNNRPKSLEPRQSFKKVIIIQIRAVDKKAKAKKQSAVDSIKVLPSDSQGPKVLRMQLHDNHILPIY